MLKLLLSFVLLAEPALVCKLGTADTAYNAYSDERSSGDALELAGKVNAALVSECRPNCPRISMFRNPTALNLMLLRDSDQVKLVYKPQFFTNVYDTYGDAGILAILAHEVGHAIDGSAKASWMKSNWSPELRADAWAGCALARMNLRLRQLNAGYAALSNYSPQSGADWNTRASVIETGYKQCGGK